MDVALIFNQETSNTQIVSIPILNDICLEEDSESFAVTATSDMDCVEIENGSVTIEIDDDDSEFFSYWLSAFLLPCDPHTQGQRSHCMIHTTKLGRM